MYDETKQAKVSIAFQGTDIKRSFTLSPLGSIEVSTEEFAGLPSSSTAEIQSDAEVVVTTQYLNFGDRQGEAYKGLAIEQGGTELFFPEVSWTRERNDDTVIYVQNLAASTITPTLLLYKRVSDPSNTLTKPIELRMESVTAYQTLEIDVGSYLVGQGMNKWEGSAVIRGSANMGGIITICSNDEQQWAMAYTAVTDR